MALSLLVSLGCGAGPLASSPIEVADEGLYDPVQDWSSAREEPHGAGATAPRLVRHPAPADPSPVLPEFSLDERRRIDRVQPFVRSAAHDHGVPTDLINGIIWVESKFRIDARRSPRGPRGLMQLMPRTGRALAGELGRRYRPHDPEFNVHAGTRYFARMVQLFDGNLTLALAAYNIGPGTVRGWVEEHQPLPERSRRYVEDVFTAARTFREKGY